MQPKASSGPGGSATRKNNAVALAGALSDNVIDATTDAFIRDADITLSGVPLENFVVETAEPAPAPAEAVAPQTEAVAPPAAGADE